MDTILPSNEITEFENRLYLNPNLTVDETSSFIDNYRNTQNQNTQQINTQTQRLGTDVPTNIGGLTGAGSYFTSRYQKPQTASVIANLKATAQAKALNDALANEQAMWKKRYQDAYNAYQKRAWDNANKTPTIDGGVEYEDTETPVNEGLRLTANAGETVIAEPDTDTGGVTGRIFVVGSDGKGKWIDNNITYKNDDAMGRHAGADQLSDIFTGMYNYTLPNGTEVELGGWDESLRVGSDGNYYIWSGSSNKYTPITGSNGSTAGGSRWWTK